MTRDEAFTYLETEYTDLSAEADWSDDSRATVYSAAVDQSLRQLGVPSDSLATAEVGEGDALAFYALLDYFTLSRLSKAFAARVDVTIAGGLAARRSQAFQSIMQLLAEAKARLAEFGLGPTNSMQMGFLNLDFLEPDLTAGEV